MRPFVLIMDASDYWVARSSRAMTAESVARLHATSNPCRKGEWIASSLTLLAMTARHAFAASRREAQRYFLQREIDTTLRKSPVGQISCRSMA